MKWFPQIVELLGKEHFREQRLRNMVYTCEDEDGDVFYVDADSSQGLSTPSVKNYNRAL